MLEKLKDLLEKQIITDANQGDTTVLAEILGLLKPEIIFNALSDDNQISLFDMNKAKDILSVDSGNIDLKIFEMVFNISLHKNQDELIDYVFRVQPCQDYQYRLTCEDFLTEIKYK